MGSHSANRPVWFPEDEPAPVTQEFGPVPPLPDYQPQGHAGTDYALPTRRALHHQKKPRKVTEQTLAILFGSAIGFFTAGVIYALMFQSSFNETYMQAAMIFNGLGIALSGIVAIGIATVHLYRTRRNL